MATNAAMAVTTLILGLKPVPKISFQDAIVTLYLLSMAWITVIASLSSCNFLSDNTKILQLASIIQSYMILALAFAVLATANKFGSTPECNQDAVAVIFRPFSALKSGRIFGWIVVGLVVVCYTSMTARDYTAQLKEKIRETRRKANGDEHSLPMQGKRRATFKYESPETTEKMKTHSNPLKDQEPHYGTATPFMSGRLVATLFFIVLFWVFFVLNTELVIRWNQRNESSIWQFGQILPMFLTILPFINMINSFKQFGLKPTKQVLHPVMVSIISDV